MPFKLASLCFFNSLPLSKARLFSSMAFVFSSISSVLSPNMFVKDKIVVIPDANILIHPAKGIDLMAVPIPRNPAAIPLSPNDADFTDFIILLRNNTIPLFLILLNSSPVSFTANL